MTRLQHHGDFSTAQVTEICTEASIFSLERRLQDCVCTLATGGKIKTKKNFIKQAIGECFLYHTIS